MRDEFIIIPALLILAVAFLSTNTTITGNIHISPHANIHGGQNLINFLEEAGKGPFTEDEYYKLVAFYLRYCQDRSRSLEAAKENPRTQRYTAGLTIPELEEQRKGAQREGGTCYIFKYDIWPLPALATGTPSGGYNQYTTSIRQTSEIGDGKLSREDVETFFGLTRKGGKGGLHTQKIERSDQCKSGDKEVAVIQRWERDSLGKLSTGNDKGYRECEYNPNTGYWRMGKEKACPSGYYFQQSLGKCTSISYIGNY